MKDRRFSRKIFTWILAAVLLGALGVLGGCGGRGKLSGEEQNGAGGSPAESAVWVPEYVSLSGEGLRAGSLRVDGDILYFVEEYREEATGASGQAIATITLSDGSRGQAIAPKEWRTDAESGAVRRCETFFRTAAGGFVTLEGVYAEADVDKNGPVEYYFCRYDNDGQKLNERDLTGELTAEGDAGRLQGAAMDGDGRLYFAMYDGSVHLADADGNYSGEISSGGVGNWIPDICAGKNGRVYMVSYERSTNGGECVIKELDFDKREVGAVCRNYPGGLTRAGMAPGAEQELLVYDGVSLYGYDTKGQAAAKLLDWMDGNINGDNVICVHVMEDGRILAIQRQQDSGDMEMAFLTPKKADEVAEKETVTVACYQRDRPLEKVIAEFNKQSDRYHVEPKIYLKDNAYGAEAWDDADLRLHADLVSDHSPDLLVLNNFYINVKGFAANGLFEDLKPWLDQSERYSYEDYFPQTLEACTYNGTLVSLPKYFSMVFLTGKAADLGNKSGWTAAEMIAFADAHPDAKLFDHYLKTHFIDMMCFYAMGNYVDWTTGECRFDSEEFVRMLELANRFLNDDDDNSWADDEDATPYKLQDGRVLLDESHYYNYYAIQELDASFGGEEICYIGYPNGEGSSGIYLSISSENIAMLVKGSHKEGAWAFLEYYMGYEEEGSELSFLANKKAFEERTQEILAGKRYLKDYKGDKVEKKGWWNWEYDVHTPTREEVDRLLALLEQAVPRDECADEIRRIIRAEAEPYFYGQKSAEAVAKIIQNRVQLYVNENR